MRVGALVWVRLDGRWLIGSYLRSEPVGDDLEIHVVSVDGVPRRVGEVQLLAPSSHPVAAAAWRECRRE